MMNKICLFLSVLLVTAVLPGFAAMSRDMDVVVVQGQEMPGFLGASITDVRVLAWNDAAQDFYPIPFQIDEVNSDSSYAFGGANGLLTELDELVVMAQDLGDQTPSTNTWPFDALAQMGKRYEIAVQDPTTGEFGYAYVFVSSTLELSPISYVSVSGDTVQSSVYLMGHNPDIASGLPTDLAIFGNNVDFLDSRLIPRVQTRTSDTLQTRAILLGFPRGLLHASRWPEGPPDKIDPPSSSCYERLF